MRTLLASAGLGLLVIGAALWLARADSRRLRRRLDGIERESVREGYRPVPRERADALRDAGAMDRLRRSGL